MKKTLIALLVLGIVSSISMVRFYYASIEIHNEYVNENTLVYLNSLNTYDDLPQWTAMRGLWKVVQTDYLMRFIFMIVSFVVLLKLIKKNETMVTPLFEALALWIGSASFMILYFLASADIYNEFVNGEILRLVNLSNVESMLPSASCTIEWVITIIDFVFRGLFMCFITVVLVKLILKEAKQVSPL